MGGNVVRRVVVVTGGEYETSQDCDSEYVDYLFHNDVSLVCFRQTCNVW